MPWSGSAGSETYSRTDGTRTGATVWAQADAASVDIVSDDHDTHDQDIADAVNACLKKDGGNSATADIPLGGNKLTGLGAGSADTDAVNVAQLNAIASGNVPSGTVMLFVQTSAPTGWTKSTTHNDKALRVVSGTASSGGTTAFSSILTSRTISQANLPDYTLTGGTAASSGSNSTGAFNHIRVSPNWSVSGVFSGSASTVSNEGNTGSALIVNADFTLDWRHTHTVSVPSGGSGTAMDFAVQYVDCIIATKD